MQTIAIKLSAVRSIAAAAGRADNELRSLIHGCGGSPRRAKRMLRSSPEVAKMLAEAYAAALLEGTHHVHAVKACNAMYLTLVPATKADAEPSDDGEGDPDEHSEEAAAADAWANGDKTITPAAPVRRRRMAAPMTAAKADASALKALLQPELI